MRCIIFSKTRCLIFVKEICKIFLFSFLIALGAKIRFFLPFTPVPITLQTFFIFLSILFLRERASLSTGVYILLGISGLPFFCMGEGLMYIFSPTGGYIIGFLIACIGGGALVHKSKTYSHYFLSLVISNMIIYACGVLWLVIGYSFTLKNALSVGVLPFMFGDTLKIIFALSIFKLLYRRWAL